LAINLKLVGVRHVLQEEPANDLMDDPAFNEGVRALGEFGLRYDVLVFARHLPQAIRFVDRHSSQVFVLDHIAKPDIRRGEIDTWAANMREFARRQNTYCKISGMVTEADAQSWSSETMRPYFEAAIDAFGPTRVMFGSDWPVCLIASSYARWVATVEEWTAGWSASEQERLWAGTAIEAYGL
jgi:L-fuconolactonase